MYNNSLKAEYYSRRKEQQQQDFYDNDFRGFAKEIEHYKNEGAKDNKKKSISLYFDKIKSRKH